MIHPDSVVFATAAALPVTAFAAEKDPSGTILAVATLVTSLAGAYIALRASKRLDKVEPAVAAVANKIEVVHKNTNSLVRKVEAAAKDRGELEGIAKEKARTGCRARKQGSRK